MPTVREIAPCHDELENLASISTALQEALLRRVAEGGTPLLPEEADILNRLVVALNGGRWTEATF